MLADRASTIAEEEAALWAACKGDGDESARCALFMRYQSLARRIATRVYRDRQLGDIEFADLFQLACTGLLEAIDHYRPDLRVPFRYYGNRRIAGAIYDGLAHMTEFREQARVHHRLQQDRLASIKAERARVNDVDDRSAALHDLGEIAAELALGFMLEDSGLFNPDEIDPTASPYDSLAWRGMTERLTAELERLSERERVVISYHYLGAIPFEQIARMLGLSKGRISQLHKSAIGTLRKRLLGAGITTLKAEPWR